MNNKVIPEHYITNVKERTWIKFFIGVVARIPKYAEACVKRRIARLRGASIGENTIISWKLALKANRKLIIGSNSIVDTDKIDLRGSYVIIKDNVIINKQCEIIRVSHYIDDDRYYTTRHFNDLIIGAYSWIATGTKILPQVTLIEQGSVTGAFSVITKNTKEDGIYAGNPATFKRTHNTRFDELVTCSLQGCDLMVYLKARFK